MGGGAVTGIRVGLFVTSFLGLLYALLSLVNWAKADALAGMAVAGVGILGWIAADVWEELR